MNRTEESFTSQIRITLILIALLTIAVVTCIAMLAANRIDQAAVARQAQYVEHGIQEIIDALPREQESITIWDDHVTFARARDQQWLAENVGEWMHSYFGHERAYVLDEGNRPIYVMRDGKTIEPAGFMDDHAIYAKLAADLRKMLVARGAGNAGEATELSEVAAVKIIALSGRPVVISARPIVPFTTRLSVPAGEEYIYVSLKYLDTEAIEEISEHFLLEGVRFERAYPAASRGAAVQVTDSDGKTIGHLSWKADRPGIALIKGILPAALFAVAVAGGIGIYLGRRLRQASQRLSASERHARHLATHDTLTRLPNRALFETSFEAALQPARGDASETALLFLDLDRFKYVNDTLGHRAGDELVRQTAKRLRAVVGTQGMVARIGGDEFAIVVSSPEAREAALQLSQDVLAEIERPFRIDEDSVHVGISIGIAIAPEAGAEREELLRKADIALYEAKKKGRGCYEVFSEAMGDILRQRRVVEADLRKALEKGDELQLFYQPIYTNSGVMTGAEALLRWNHPVHGGMSPVFLIAIAEEAGMIMQLGDWILREACRMTANLNLLWISVNVSAMQLRDEHFADRCLAIINEMQVAPERIQIEVTETVLIENRDLAVATFKKLRASGVRVAIDDFGTGYSSMSYLQNYPVDSLKIDRSFIQALSDNEEGRAIVGAMVEMARALKLNVVAEGVETVDQRDMLSAMGCGTMQGYLFSRPLKAHQFVQFSQEETALRA
ncbi:putative bifunctional diguanylate cyclase/phosphodiesterase [Chelativorans salis]|uniref:EAL domain-containing protein n=1 Tax=Chelativorans salis TaxID=2978478 RepID=A0ABT2LJG5_9HYPH|nr:EAL domain-containing protein [Chelativorans sp. EGI FJ00035]MCT7374371.1 EAL domain-containing protein [Chelativorans sp. EGI FJ00035]